MFDCSGAAFGGACIFGAQARWGRYGPLVVRLSRCRGTMHRYVTHGQVSVVLDFSNQPFWLTKPLVMWIVSFYDAAHMRRVSYWRLCQRGWGHYWCTWTTVSREAKQSLYFKLGPAARAHPRPPARHTLKPSYLPTRMVVCRVLSCHTVINHRMV